MSRTLKCFLKHLRGVAISAILLSLILSALITLGYYVKKLNKGTLATATLNAVDYNREVLGDNYVLEFCSYISPTVYDYYSEYAYCRYQSETNNKPIAFICRDKRPTRLSIEDYCWLNRRDLHD